MKEAGNDVQIENSTTEKTHQMKEYDLEEKKKIELENELNLLKSDCPDCRLERRSGNQFDPNPLDLFLCLHAFSYSLHIENGPNWFFKTELPSWAKGFPLFYEIPKEIQDFEKLFGKKLEVENINEKC